MSRQEELEQTDFNDLRVEAKELGLSGAGSKADLVERIVRFEMTGDVIENGEAAAQDADDVGTPPEDAAPAADDTDAGVDDGADVHEPTVEAAEAEEDQDDADKVLVRYTGKSPSFQFGKYTFSVQHPFAVVGGDYMEHAVAKHPRFFRPATQQEVERYYS